jgi:hypothetical protein
VNISNAPTSVPRKKGLYRFMRDPPEENEARWIESELAATTEAPRELSLTEFGRARI